MWHFPTVMCVFKWKGNLNTAKTLKSLTHKISLKILFNEITKPTKTACPFPTCTNISLLGNSDSKCHPHPVETLASYSNLTNLYH